tara:strand:+ start:399 stop:1313 length:915 start_codon:yes stop_codon:yes gene_type:complete
LIPLCSPKEAKLPTALALGSFDGLHAGHRQVIKSITNQGPGIPTVVSFWPHPREVLFGESRLRLDLPSEKTSLLEPLGIKQLVLVAFDNDLAELNPETFITEILHKTLQAKRVGIGANFRFGRNREGDASTLREVGKSLGIEVIVVPIIEDNAGRMSSSRIRSALGAGDLKEAKSLLGRSYSFHGRVIKGKGIGKGIGWPTANLEVNGRKFLPALGVYAAWAMEANGSKGYPAVMNLGPQPTIDPNSPSAVEVHFLDQEINLLNKELVIEPVQKLRDQIKFDNLQELSKQIKIDADLSRTILRT